jgi:hypothetical protein
MDEGTELTSDVVLIAADGSSTILIPDAISQDTITVTIPGTLAKGNYKLKTEKLDKYSNPKVISIKPSAVINSVNCKKKNGHITISGAGFGEKPQGTDAYLTVDVNGENVAITYWADTLIKGVVSSCPGDSDVITVNALFGSATW